MKKIIQHIASSSKTNRLPLELTLRRIYILPTKSGLVFCVILTAMLIGSMNYNNNLGFLLVFLLGSMGFVSIIHTVNNLNGLEIRRTQANPVFAGEIAVFEIFIRSLKDHRSVNFQFKNRSGPQTVDLHASNPQRFVRIALKAGKRGIFRPGDLIVSTLFPFGWFRAWAVIRYEFSCLIYPQPLAGPLALKTEILWDAENGNHSRTAEGNDDFQGLKLYQTGDRLNRISWKSYSKGQGLFTKVFEGEAGTSVILDFNRLTANDLEVKLSQLCWMVLKAHKQHQPFGLQIPGHAIPPGQGNKHKNKCLASLARYT